MRWTDWTGYCRSVYGTPSWKMGKRLLSRIRSQSLKKGVIVMPCTDSGNTGRGGVFRERKMVSVLGKLILKFMSYKVNVGLPVKFEAPEGQLEGISSVACVFIFLL